MPMLGLTVRGLSEARAGLARWSPQAFAALVAPEASQVLVQWLRYYIVKRTGQTADTLGATVSGTHVQAMGDLIAWFLYSGTRPHVIRARNAQARAFPGGSGMVFARQVMHPGTAGTNYPLAAWESASPEIAAIAQRAAAALIGGRP